MRTAGGRWLGNANVSEPLPARATRHRAASGGVGELFLDEIYATLVVRLHHNEPFQQDQLWRYAADFKTNTGKQLGVKLTRPAPGVGELEVYFDPAVAMEEKIAKYVHEHLLQHARDVERLRHYVCPQCGTPVGNREVAMKRLNDWLQWGAHAPRVPFSAPSRKTSGVFTDTDPAEAGRTRGASGNTRGRVCSPSIICVGREQRVPLWDEMEQCFASRRFSSGCATCRTRRPSC